MLKTISIIILTSLTAFILSCGTLPPQLPRAVELYRGVSEHNGIARINDNDEIDIIKANEDEFNKFVCQDNEDYEMLIVYIEELKFACKIWK